MATKEEIKEALREAGEALRKLQFLVDQGVPEDMWEPSETDEEQLEAVDLAYDIATTLLPMYMEEEYYEVENYVDSLMQGVDGLQIVY